MACSTFPCKEDQYCDTSVSSLGLCEYCKHEICNTAYTFFHRDCPKLCAAVYNKLMEAEATPTTEPTPIDADSNKPWFATWVSAIGISVLVVMCFVILLLLLKLLGRKFPDLVPVLRCFGRNKEQAAQREGDEEEIPLQDMERGGGSRADGDRQRGQMDTPRSMEPMEPISLEPMAETAPVIEPFTVPRPPVPAQCDGGDEIVTSVTVPKRRI